MTIRDKNPVEPRAANRYPLIFDVYARALSGMLLLLGLRHWAVILGLIAGGGGMFVTMSTSWQLATMHFAVVDIVAATGLWMRVAWGNVVWIYAAVAEIILHVVFYGKFGTDILLVAFHLLTIGGFAVLFFLAQRPRPA
jgi:hypothetical protein